MTPAGTFARFLHQCDPTDLPTACAKGLKLLPPREVARLIRDHLSPRRVRADGVSPRPISDEEIREALREAENEP